MKKEFLLTLLMTFVGIFTVQATSVVIDVDHANNVIVQTNSGYGQTLELQDGMNRFDLNDQTDNPILINATEGAKIESVTQDGDINITPGGDGHYRVGFATAGTMIKIVTSGNGSGGGGGDVVKNVNISFSVSGEGITGKPFTVYYEKDSEWVKPETSYGMSVIPENANIKIVPERAFDIVGCSVPGSNVTIEGTLNDDGSYVFINNVPDYYNVKVEMKMKDSAIRFSITADYAANLSCFLENQRLGNWEVLTVYDNVKTDFVIVAEQNPLEFMAAEGADIVKVIKNGVEQQPIGWEGAGGYVFEVQDGDEFVVTTKGAPTDILLEAAENNAPLQSYFFRRADGSVLDLSGMSATFRGNLGETIRVSARPGTELSYVIGSNGGKTNMLDNLMVVAGVEGPAKYQIYGTRNVNGVVLSVDDAGRVSVVQEGGRGDALTLQNGKNEFSLADIRNALAISSTDGNQIVSVSVNGDDVVVSPNGYYLVEAEEGDWIEVKSRKNPIDVTLKYAFNEGADITWLQAVSEGQPVSLGNPMTVKSYTTLEFSAADGYVLESLSCATPGVTVLPVPDAGKYELTVATADVTEAEISVVMKEIEASEGNSIVIPNGESLFVKFWEMTPDDVFVKELDNNRVNEVKTGNLIRVYCKDSQSEFVYVKANGENVELIRNEAGLARTAYITVTGRTVIDTKIGTPCQAYTDPTRDTKKHIVSGNVYIVVDGEKYTKVNVSAGQTIKLVAEPEPGYIFDHYEMFFTATAPDNGIVIEGDTYTFSETDVQENFILFKGVFTEDWNNKVYVLRGSTAWMVDENGNPVTETSSALGNVLFVDKDGEYVPELTAFAGETVHLEIATNSEEIYNKYEVYGFCLMAGFPTAIIPADYVVNAEDADSEDVIWISGLMRLRDTGVESVGSDEGNFFYDSSRMTVSSPEGIRIFTVNGQLVISSDESEVSVAGLENGVYVAVSGGRTIKFVK